MPTSTCDPFPGSPPTPPGDRLRSLVVGYGNDLRSDDGVGRAVVANLAARLGEGVPSALQLRSCHQLLPELAADLAAVDRAVFADARIDPIPADAGWQERDPEVGVWAIALAPDPDLSQGALGHAASPVQLLSLAQWLYGRAPQAWAIAILGDRFDHGDRLSVPAQRRAAVAADWALELLNGG